MKLPKQYMDFFFIGALGFLQCTTCLIFDGTLTTDTSNMQISATTEDDYCVVAGLSLTMACTYELENSETISNLRWYTVAPDGTETVVYNSNGINAGAIQSGVLENRATASFSGSGRVTNTLVIDSFNSTVDVKDYICRIGLGSGVIEETSVTLTTETIETTEISSNSYIVRNNYNAGEDSVEIEVTPPIVGGVTYPNPVPEVTAGTDNLNCTSASTTTCTVDISGVNGGVTVIAVVRIGSSDYSNMDDFAIVAETTSTHEPTIAPDNQNPATDDPETTVAPIIPQTSAALNNPQTTQVQLSTTDDGEDSNDNNVLYFLFIPFGVIAISLLIAGVVLCIRHSENKKKKRKSKPRANKHHGTAGTNFHYRKSLNLDGTQYMYAAPTEPQNYVIIDPAVAGAQAGDNNIYLVNDGKSNLGYLPEQGSAPLQAYDYAYNVPSQVPRRPRPMESQVYTAQRNSRPRYY